MIDFEYIRQTFVRAEGFSTGVACLLTMIKYHGGYVPPWLLMEWTGTIKGMTYMTGLQQGAQNSGLTSRAIRMNIEQLRGIIEPVLLFIEREDGKKDYAICYGFDGNRFALGDTSWGLMQYWPEELEVMWIKGIALILYPNDSFILESNQKRIVERFVYKYVRANRKYLQVFILGAILSTVLILTGIKVNSIDGMFVLLIIGVFLYYILSIAYLKWKTNTTVRIIRFIKIAVEQSVWEDATDNFLLVIKSYPRIVVLIIYVLVGLTGLLTYLFWTEPFLALFAFLYIPLSSIFIAWNGQKIEKKHHFNKGDMTELLEIKRLQTNSLAILNAGLIGLVLLLRFNGSIVQLDISYPDILIGFFSSFFSFTMTTCFLKIIRLREAIHSLYWILKEKVMRN